MKDEVVNALYEGGKAVRLYGRTGDYEVDFPDAFYLHSGQVDRLPSAWSDGVEELEGGFSRVRWPERSRGSRRARLRYFNENVFKPRGIDPLEADLSPTQRFLIENPSIRIAEKWKLLWFDLETEQVKDWDKPWRSRILAFSWRSSSGAKGHVRAKSLTDEAERELLRTFARLADRHDILLAWNGDRFDFRVVTSRCELQGVPFDKFLYHWLDTLRLFKRYYLRSEDGGVTSSFALNAVAEGLLGEKKIPIEPLAREKGWDGSGDLFTWLWEYAPDLFRDYNDHDVELMYLLEGKTGFIDLHLALCRICRVLPAARSLFPMNFVDGKMLQRGQEVGYHFPSRPTDEVAFHRAKGAFVPEADVGLHESVAVLDYARMYPSIIRTFNMSLETLDPNGELTVPDTNEQGRLTGQHVARFRASPEGHLPAALRGIIEARKVYSERQGRAEVGSPEFHDAARLSNACKVLANVFYGVILSPMSRFHRQEIGESVTSFGRYLLASTIKAAEGRGHRLVFGDTDSVAIRATDEEAAALKDQMNQVVIPELVRKTGAEPGEVIIDFEKRYRRILVTASKRYAGTYALYKGKSAAEDAPMDVRGLEIVRSDVCKAARNLQRATLEFVLEGESPEVIWKGIREERDRFWDGSATIEELILAKSITKPIDDYATKPLQVKVAERMAAAGMEVGVGSKIPFLMTLAGPVHPSELETEESVDRVAYWNKYVYPPTLRVLEAAFKGRGWEGLLFQKGVNPGQIELFVGGIVTKQERPVRKVRKVRQVRRVLRLVTLVVREDLDAPRLKKALEAFPGPLPVRVVIEVRAPDHRADVILDVPQKIADPSKNPTLTGVLRTLGARVRPLETKAA